MQLPAIGFKLRKNAGMSSTFKQRGHVQHGADGTSKFRNHTDRNFTFLKDCKMDGALLVNPKG